MHCTTLITGCILSFLAIPVLPTDFKLYDEFAEPTTILFTGGRIYVKGCWSVNTDKRGTTVQVNTYKDQCFKSDATGDSECCKIVIPEKNLVPAYDYTSTRIVCENNGNNVDIDVPSKPIKRAIAMGQCERLVGCIRSKKGVKLLDIDRHCPVIQKHGTISSVKPEQISQCEAYQQNNAIYDAIQQYSRIPYFFAEVSKSHGTCPPLNEANGFQYKRTGDNDFSPLTPGLFIFYEAWSKTVQPATVEIKPEPTGKAMVCRVDWVKHAKWWHQCALYKGPYNKASGVELEQKGSGNEWTLTVTIPSITVHNSIKVNFTANVVIKVHCTYDVEQDVKASIYFYYTSTKLELCTSNKRKTCELPFWVDNSETPNMVKDMYDVNNKPEKYWINCSITVRMCFPFVHHATLSNAEECYKPTNPEAVFKPAPVYTHDQKEAAAKATFDAKKRALTNLWRLEKEKEASSGGRRNEYRGREHHGYV